ncbi:MAG: CDP-4-keto-6-deoxy-D-glucose-3-dehydrase [Chthoniobacterales bacterium]|nr:MAG: CDP-4-keto-6-deoxy-D-glucose-3-dehydrase [Chthoniobacterales bacterium]
MSNNITHEDIDALMKFLGTGSPILTQSRQVESFEREWSEWLGGKHSVFVNSGASANLLTIAAIKYTFGEGEVIVPTLTWISDIASVLHCSMKPVFVDIDPRTLGMDLEQVLAKITPETKAVFLTHVLGYNAMTEEFVAELKSRGIPLIEDVCESHGATMKGVKLGNFGLMSNFSFYYAHHLSTIEGGIVCTNDDDLYEKVRMLRSHGMTRESKSSAVRESYISRYPDLNPNFIFAYPAWNVRSTELNAVIGRSQLKRLDANNNKRIANLQIFLENLDSQKYLTDFATEGSCNYAFTLILREPSQDLWERVERVLKERGIEFRRGTSGGGNQLRQPYLRALFPDEYRKYPRVDHVHFYGAYIGNYPELQTEKIRDLCRLLREV